MYVLKTNTEIEDASAEGDEKSWWHSELKFLNFLSVFRAPRQMQAGDVGASNSDIVTDKAEDGDTHVQDRFVWLWSLQVACVADAWNWWAEERTGRARETRRRRGSTCPRSPRKSFPVRYPITWQRCVLSYVHYFQAPATQASLKEKNWFLFKQI